MLRTLANNIALIHNVYATIRRLHTYSRNGVFECVYAQCWYLDVCRHADLRGGEGHGGALLGSLAHPDPGASHQAQDTLLLDGAPGGRGHRQRVRLTGCDWEDRQRGLTQRLWDMAAMEI